MLSSAVMSQDAFLESLKAYLHRLAERPSPNVNVDTVGLDPPWMRNLLLCTLERVERGEAQNQSLQKRATSLLEEWRTGDRILVFVRELVRLLKQSLAAGANIERQKHLVELGLSRWFELPGELSSRVQTYELDRIVKQAQKIAWEVPSVFVGLDILRYAASNQLVISQPGQPPIVSPLGEVFQHLQGRDAVRWLLQVEARMSLGQFDIDRLSKEAASAILTAGSWRELEMDGYEEFPCNATTALRLASMGLLVANSAEMEDYSMLVTYWSVSSLGRELLGELVQPDRTPLALLAESLCSDLLSSALQSVRGDTTILRGSAAEATASQARMVAHEVRNALLPVQAALDSLYKEVLILPPNEAVSRRRLVIDGGIKGALRFTKELLQTAELGAKPPERFESVQAICEVVAELAGTSPVTIEAPATGPLPLLLGRREHFVLVVRNLLQNAIQHGGVSLRRVSIEMSLDEAEDAVRLTIDDDGQGVDDADRDRIFQEGVSKKPGGTGLGLSWVQRVVQEELRGVVICTRSPLGGARFVVRLPIVGVDKIPSAKEKKR